MTLEMTLFVILMIGYTTAGLSMALLHFVYSSPKMERYLISDDPNRSVSGKRLARDAVLNMAVSVALIFAMTYGLKDYLFYATETPLWVMAIEAVAAVLVYDFGYYFMHRYPFHEWRLLRWVHSVHHAARNPRTVDSLLLHPIETVGGLGLLYGTIWLIGGVHIYTFAPIFVAYTTLNVWNHAGVMLPFFGFRTMGKLSLKHDRHHHSMMAGNYASITPLPDIVFGTVAAP